MWWHLLLECIEADESGARAAACSKRRLVEESRGEGRGSAAAAKGMFGLQRTVEDMLHRRYSRGTGGSSAADSAGTGAARATTGIRVVGACVQLGAETKDNWGNTGHVDMLAALDAVGVGGGRGYDGDCRGLRR